MLAETKLVPVEIVKEEGKVRTIAALLGSGLASLKLKVA